LDALAAERARAVSPQLSANQRLEAAERLLEIREGLLATQADDPRRAVWLADQAADLLFVLLPIDGSGLTSLFGAPSAPQRARALRVAREVSRLGAEAGLEIDRVILGLESAPGYTDDLAAQMRRRRLAETERDRRIPFLIGAGACLQAELETDDPTQAEPRYRLAAEKLRPLIPLLADRPADLARLYAGLALGALGEHDEAVTRLDELATDPKAEPADLFAARMAKVLISADRSGPNAGLEALDGLEQSYDHAGALFYRLLIADQRFLLHRDAAQQGDAAQHQRHLVAAFDAYVGLLDLDQLPAASPLRAAVLARLTRAVDAETPLARMPAIVSVARAEQLAQDPDTRPQALDLFGQLIERRDLSDLDRAEALWGMGRALLADRQLHGAAGKFGRLARDHPTARHAEPAVAVAATIAAELYRRDPGDGSSRTLLRSTLDLLLARYPNLASVDRWRFTAASLALDEGRYERAVTLFAQVPPDAGQWLDAQLRRAAALRAWAKTEGDPDAMRLRWQQVLDAANEVAPAVRRAMSTAPSSPRHDQLAVLSVYRAEAQLGLGEITDALETLQGVGDDCSLAADAALARIDAYTRQGRSDQVEQELERLLAVAGPRAGALLGAMLADRQQTSGGSDELMAVADALERWLRTAGDDVGDRTRLELGAADAYRSAGRWRAALGLYDAVLQRQPNTLEPLLGRAECLWELGDEHLADAMQIYKRISAATAGKGNEYYWQSQLRMLQILDRTGRNTQRIAPHVQQLRRKDPELGGDRFRRKLESLQAKHS
ncbi:MAG: tetratricopeptide repeat protein, partial [Planctomycetota bacterium]